MSLKNNDWKAKNNKKKKNEGACWKKKGRVKKNFKKDV